MQQLHRTFILVRLWVLLKCNSNETAVGVARVRCEKRECTARLRLKIDKYLTQLSQLSVHIIYRQIIRIFFYGCMKNSEILS